MKFYRNILITALLLLFVFPGASGAIRAPTEARALEIEPPVEVTLDWDGDPGLQQTVTLTVRVLSELAAEDLNIEWIVPAGVTASGPTHLSLGRVEANRPHTQQIDLTFGQSGTFKVVVGAQMQAVDYPMTLGDADVLFFEIDGSPRVYRERPPMEAPYERIDTPHLQYTVSSRPEGGYWVRGTFLYEDLVINESGSPTPNLVPARQVRVEIWEDDPVFDDHDGTTRTDNNGDFEFFVSNNDDGWFGGDKETYLKIKPNTPGAYVTDRTFIDDEYYVYTDNASGGNDIDFGSMKPTTFDPMFNIADILLDARDYVEDLRSAPGQAKVQYEFGYGETVSFYDTFWNEITLADASSDPDGYDDSVIVHEYGHWIAHNYACDESPGGRHVLTGHYSRELAWSEGWASYLSSAVRGVSWYRDTDGSGGGFSVNWEGWSVTGSTNEGAVTATLWDLHDPDNESHDRLDLGGDEIWDVVDNRLPGADKCTIPFFYDEWVDAGYPSDSELASIFGNYNTSTLLAQAEGVRSLPLEPIPAQVVQSGPLVGPDGRTVRAQEVAPQRSLDGQVPWNGVLFLVDATASMSEEIDAVKQIVQNQVSDLDGGTEAYEYIVETFQDDGSNDLVVDEFFPDLVNPAVDGISVGGGGGAAEDAFAALVRGTAAGERLGFDAWLLSDGEARQLYSVEQTVNLLQSRQVTPYFFIFGDCTDPNALAAARDVEASRVVPAHRPNLPRFAPAGLAECIEPYLLVSSGANGQFLFIDSSQIGDAAEIVRAFMNNNAGAGRYADYVSSSWTYTWDDTDFTWYDTSGGDFYSYHGVQSFVMPEYFDFYTFYTNTIHVASSGYLSFSDYSLDWDNTAIPSGATPNNSVYAFWDEIWTYVIPEENPKPEQTYGIYVDHDAAENRYVVEYHAYHNAGYEPEVFQIQLDLDTYEIYLLYSTVSDDSSATVGVENPYGTIATQLAYNNAGFLYEGRAIKLTPQPPQSTRDHEVLVDSTMDGVVFLLNGYSGEVDLTVYDPNNDPINPADPDVTYLSVGSVIYYRVDNPQAGTWVGQASGEGTYYFTSSAASPLDSDLLSDLSLTTAIPSHILIAITQAVSDTSFSLIRPDGSLFDTLYLFDDGEHGDGEAGDGRYGGWYAPPAAGMAHLQVDGQLPDGEDFRRFEQRPLIFQDMELAAPFDDERYVLPGGTAVYTFTLWNDSNFGRNFELLLDTTAGGATLPYTQVYVPAHSPSEIPVTIYAGLSNVDIQTSLTAQTSEMADSATVTSTVRGPVTSIELERYPDQVPVDGYEATLYAYVLDDIDWIVADGTEVEFQTSLGAISPSIGATVDGTVTATLTSGSTTGTAQVLAIAEGVVQTITVDFVENPAYTLTVSTGDAILLPNGISTTQVTVQVMDKYGDPAPDGSQVVVGVEGDDAIMGSIEDQEVYTGTTSGGVLELTYRSSTTAGLATIRAELPLEGSAGGGEGIGENRWATTTILLQQTYPYHIYLPFVAKNW